MKLHTQHHTPFDPDLLILREVHLHKASQSDGGMLTIRDENGKRTRIRVKKIPAPTIWYDNPQPTLIVEYNGTPLCYSGVGEDVQFQKETFIRLKAEMVEALNASDDCWFIHDSMMYKFRDGVAHSSGLGLGFSAVEFDVTSVNNLIMGISPLKNLFTKVGISFKNVVTPPLWSNLNESIGRRANSFAELNDNTRCNMNSLLMLCDCVARNLGSERVEQFNLVDYMIEFDTVNLTSLPKATKESALTSLTISHYIAYCLGLFHKHNIKQAISLIAYAMSYGLLRQNMYDEKNIYKVHQTS